MSTTDAPVSAVDRLLAEEAAQPRADAKRNVARLVAAAREAVDEIGLDVTAHEIARRAGVGIGTFYRRVPSREALLEAVVYELFDKGFAAADAGLADPDPWRGFAGFATAYVHLRAASCGVNEALGEQGAKLNLSGPATVLRDRIRLLVARAQEAGVMRTDVTWQDVAFVLGAVIPGESTMGIPAADEQWRVNLKVLLDGLRTPKA